MTVFSIYNYDFLYYISYKLSMYYSYALYFPESKKVYVNILLIFPYLSLVITTYINLNMQCTLSHS